MKPYKNKVRGYVNMSSAVIESEVERQSKAYGPNYSSIDFGFNSNSLRHDPTEKLDSTTEINLSSGILEWFKPFSPFNLFKSVFPEHHI